MLLLNRRQKFEFTPDGVSKRAIATIDFYKDAKVRSPINRAFTQLI
jgi:transketolase